MIIAFIVNEGRSETIEEEKMVISVTVNRVFVEGLRTTGMDH